MCQQSIARAVLSNRFLEIIEAGDHRSHRTTRTSPVQLTVAHRVKAEWLTAWRVWCLNTISGVEWKHSDCSAVVVFSSCYIDPSVDDFANRLSCDVVRPRGRAAIHKHFDFRIGAIDAAYINRLEAGGGIQGKLGLANSVYQLLRQSKTIDLRARRL